MPCSVINRKEGDGGCVTVDERSGRDGCGARVRSGSIKRCGSNANLADSTRPCDGGVKDEPARAVEEEGSIIGDGARTEGSCRAAIAYLQGGAGGDEGGARIAIVARDGQCVAAEGGESQGTVGTVGEVVGEAEVTQSCVESDGGSGQEPLAT